MMSTLTDVEEVVLYVLLLLVGVVVGTCMLFIILQFSAFIMVSRYINYFRRLNYVLTIQNPHCTPLHVFNLAVVGLVENGTRRKTNSETLPTSVFDKCHH